MQQSYVKVLLISAVLILCTQQREVRDTGLVPEQEDPLLIFSTIGGSFVGVSQRTGEIRWKQHDEPAVKVPQTMSDSALPMFLPDPKDGSLYIFGIESEALKKLPFTIPQLVANSPCRSSDGILYTGRKIDTWFSIDPITGDREQLFGFDKAESTCPLKSQDVLFIGRTEYNIIMIDSKHKDKKWNVTFYDYSAVKMDPDVNENYEFVHFTASSSGRVVTIDRLGKAIWKIDLGSPVVAAYTASKDTLITVPFTSVSDKTLDHLMNTISSKPSDIQLYPTLYIGEHRHGLYALPSLVDSSTATITGKSARLLLEGPLVTENDKENATPLSNDHVYVTSSDVIDENQNNYDKSFSVIGHYEIPDEHDYRQQNQPLQITGRSDPVIQNEFVAINSTKLSFGLKSNCTGNATWTSGPRGLLQWFIDCKEWINQQENKGLKIAFVALVALVVWMFWYLNVRFKEFQQLSQQYDQGSRESSRTSSNGRNGFIHAAEDVGEGLIRVGKITFDSGQVLGKGCDGTFVYKGEFDGRSVAVKRLLPDCFTFADREVALLRESDAHANVVRYFCTEQDKLFRYIALELAEATLQDYVIGKYNRKKISITNILRQATSGLAHLHLLDIVHRDIKPHNVLLSMPGPSGEVRAMISDFGLCKKLQLGRISFSRRSGITGTDGWIAPEMLNGERTTCAVDIFSLGCVFYYVLSGGKHPFGDPLRRQANILCGETDMTHLQNMKESDQVSALLLIKAMIASNPAERPPASAVHNYPIFWTPAQILSFFQDVSDRVEKEGPESPELVALEKDNLRIVQKDWRLHIDAEVASDLRKYRSYRGDNVRDLLRALRNKKNHYRELAPAAQKSLGCIPEEFTEYWLSRFPHLLTHVWCAMQQFRTETTLKTYYHYDYAFPIEESEEMDNPVENEDPNVTFVKSEEQAVDWSPNRLKNRGPRRRFHPSKKSKEPVTFKMTPTS